MGFPGWASDLITTVTPSPRLHPASAGAQGLAGGKASVLCWAGGRGLDRRLSVHLSWRPSQPGTGSLMLSHSCCPPLLCPSIACPTPRPHMSLGLARALPLAVPPGHTSHVTRWLSHCSSDPDHTLPESSLPAPGASCVLDPPFTTPSAACSPQASNPISSWGPSGLPPTFLSPACGAWPATQPQPPVLRLLKLGHQLKKNNLPD